MAGEGAEIEVGQDGGGRRAGLESEGLKEERTLSISLNITSSLISLSMFDISQPDSKRSICSSPLSALSTTSPLLPDSRSAVETEAAIIFSCTTISSGAPPTNPRDGGAAEDGFSTEVAEVEAEASANDDADVDAGATDGSDDDEDADVADVDASGVKASYGTGDLGGRGAEKGPRAVAPRPLSDGMNSDHLVLIFAL